jgi:hypothetical protein
MPRRLPAAERERLARLDLLTVARGRAQLARRRLARAGPAAAATDLVRAERALDALARRLRVPARSGEAGA